MASEKKTCKRANEQTPRGVCVCDEGLMEQALAGRLRGV